MYFYNENYVDLFQSVPYFDKGLLLLWQLLQRMLADRETSYQALVTMSQGIEMSPLVSEQMSQLERQWKTVNEIASANQKTLQETLAAAKDYNENLQPFLIWLDKRERQLSQSRLQTPYVDKATEHIQELAVRFSVSIVFTPLLDA